MSQWERGRDLLGGATKCACRFSRFKPFWEIEVNKVDMSFSVWKYFVRGGSEEIEVNGRGTQNNILRFDSSQQNIVLMQKFQSTNLNTLLSRKINLRLGGKYKPFRLPKIWLSLLGTCVLVEDDQRVQRRWIDLLPHTPWSRIERGNNDASKTGSKNARSGWWYPSFPSCAVLHFSFRFLL